MLFGGNQATYSTIRVTTILC